MLQKIWDFHGGESLDGGQVITTVSEKRITSIFKVDFYLQDSYVVAYLFALL
jgi:hypothetical protein